METRPKVNLFSRPRRLCFTCLSVHLSVNNFAWNHWSDPHDSRFIDVSLDMVVTVKFWKSAGLRIHAGSTLAEWCCYTLAVKSDICSRRFLLYSKETVDVFGADVIKVRGMVPRYSPFENSTCTHTSEREMTFRWSPVWDHRTSRRSLYVQRLV